MKFEWDEVNRSHIAEHKVTAEEAEQVVLGDLLDVEVQLRNGEERTIQVGETDSGRVLVVVTTFRGQRLRVVTAFPANKKLRNLYAKYQK